MVIQSGIYFIIIVLFCKSIFLVVFLFCFVFFLSIRLQTEPEKIFDVHFVMCGYKNVLQSIKREN